MTPTWAVIPSEGRSCLHDCIASVRDQVDGIIVVANGDYDGSDLSGVIVMRDPDAHPNISRWWNIGLDSVARCVVDRGIVQWNVLVLNDDTIMDRGSVGVLTTGLRRHPGAQLAFCGPGDRLLTSPGPDRITGWCFVVRGEGGLRADESLEWWYSDNTLDWEARACGGSVIVTGVGHEHLYPNGYTVSNPELSLQAGCDQAIFLARWGRLPH